MYQYRGGTKRWLRIRELVMQGVPDREIRKRFRLGEHGLGKIALIDAELPKQCCSGCGGLVVMPCRLCAVRG